MTKPLQHFGQKSGFCLFFFFWEKNVLANFTGKNYVRNDKISMNCRTGIIVKTGTLYNRSRFFGPRFLFKI